VAVRRSNLSEYSAVAATGVAVSVRLLPGAVMVTGLPILQSH